MRADDRRELFPAGLQKAAAASGIGFVVLLILSIALGQPAAPDFAAPGPEWRAFGTENHDELQLGALLLGLALFAFIWFAAVLYGLLSTAERVARGFSRVAHVVPLGALFAAACFGVSAAVAAAGATLPDDTDGTVVRALHFVGSAIASLAGAGMGAMLIAAGLLIGRLNVLPRWLAPLGIAAGAVYVLTLLNLLTIEDDESALGFLFPIAFLLTLVWIAAASVLMIIRVDRPGAVQDH